MFLNNGNLFISLQGTALLTTLDLLKLLHVALL